MRSWCFWKVLLGWLQASGLLPTLKQGWLWWGSRWWEPEQGRGRPPEFLPQLWSCHLVWTWYKETSATPLWVSFPELWNSGVRVFRYLFPSVWEVSKKGILNSESWTLWRQAQEGQARRVQLTSILMAWPVVSSRAWVLYSGQRYPWVWEQPQHHRLLHCSSWSSGIQRLSTMLVPTIHGPLRSGQGYLA